MLTYASAIILGIIVGILPYQFLHGFGTLIADAFIKIFKCISLPIISLSIIVTLAHYDAGSKMKQAWKKTLFYTITTTLIAASVACILYLIISPPNVVDASNINSDIVNKTAKASYLSYLINLIPANMFAPFLEHQVISVLLVSIATGIAIRCIPDADSRTTITNFFQGMHGIFIAITRWVVKLIPIAMFGFIVVTVIQLKGGMLSFEGLSKYLLVVVIANVVQGLIVLPTLLYLNQINPWKTLKGMMPALSMAFFSKSSAGTLPVTMETAERNLGVSHKISRFILPLCTSINMNGCAAFIFTTVIYLMQNHGIEITFATMLLWIVISTIAAIGNAGVPMGCFFLSASLLASMSVPVTLLGVILPFYSLIDMVETALNVWSDSCVVSIVDKKYHSLEEQK